jgi:hypothetical protein
MASKNHTVPGEAISGSRLLPWLPDQSRVKYRMIFFTQFSFFSHFTSEYLNVLRILIYFVPFSIVNLIFGLVRVMNITRQNHTCWFHISQMFYFSTVELNLSRLTGMVSRLDMQKIWIIWFIFENKQHWQFEVEKISTNGYFRLHIFTCK